MDGLGLVLALLGMLILGFVLGIVVTSIRAVRLAAERRAIAGANAGFARLWPTEGLPVRSAADIVAGRIRVVLGNVPYDLPVLPRRASREWLANLDRSFQTTAAALEEAADDKPRILALLASQTDLMLGALRAYDVGGVLPDPAFLDEYATDAEILVAMVEVWRATNPLAVTLAEDVAATTDGTSFDPSSPSLPSTDGVLTTSTV